MSTNSGADVVEYRLRALEQTLTADPLDRTEANALMRQVFSQVVLDYDSGFLPCHFKHGGVGEVVIAWPKDRD